MTMYCITHSVYSHTRAHLRARAGAAATQTFAALQKAPRVHGGRRGKGKHAARGMLHMERYTRNAIGTCCTRTAARRTLRLECQTPCAWSADGCYVEQTQQAQTHDGTKDGMWAGACTCSHRRPASPRASRSHAAHTCARPQLTTNILTRAQQRSPPAAHLTFRPHAPGIFCRNHRRSYSASSSAPAKGLQL